MKVSAQKWKVKSNGRMRLKSKILKLTGQRDQQTDVTEKSVTVTEDGGTEITQPEQRKENHSGGSQAQRPVGQTLKVCLSPWGPPKEEEPPRSGQLAPPVCRTPPAPGSRETHTQTRLRKRREPGTEEPGRQRGGGRPPSEGQPLPGRRGRRRPGCHPRRRGRGNTVHGRRRDFPSERHRGLRPATAALLTAASTVDGAHEGAEPHTDLT